MFQNPYRHVSSESLLQIELAMSPILSEGNTLIYVRMTKTKDKNYFYHMEHEE
jgi:hypothetical protein